MELLCAWHTSLLVDLNGGLVVLNSNDLSYKVVVTDTDLRSLAYAPKRVVKPHTSSYMATPIMFSATMTGLMRLVGGADVRGGDVPGDGEDLACNMLATAAIS